MLCLKEKKIKNEHLYVKCDKIMSIYFNKPVNGIFVFDDRKAMMPKRQSRIKWP